MIKKQLLFENYFNQLRILTCQLALILNIHLIEAPNKTAD